ncbi:MAG: hypothetical protein AAF950_06845 [Pseudomonadota bacterium]
MLIEILEKGHHAFAFHEVTRTRNIIREDFCDFIAFRFGILAAAMLLGVEPTAFFCLFGAADTAVDDGFKALICLV